METKETIKLAKAAFEKLSDVFYSEMRNHADNLLDRCIVEEKEHRGWGPDFAGYHTSDTASVRDCAKLFAVKRVADYIKTQDYPKGKDYLHTQKSCFTAAGIADEYRAGVLKEWTVFDINVLAALDYTDVVKVRQTIAAA